MPSAVPSVAVAETESAPAKLNLSLHVVGRRQDGYHRLESIVAFANHGDRVTVAPAPPGAGLSLTVTGRFAPALAAEADNLVLRAARRLAEAAGRPADLAITLDKQLPIASGIGGGSADAAASLRALSRLWRLDLPADRLHAIAAALGADVPVCLAARPALMQGIGEQVTALPPLPPLPLLLVNPGIPLATPPVFKARQGPFRDESADPAGTLTCALAAAGPDPVAAGEALLALLAPLGNDLTEAAVSLCPAIAAVLGRISATPACRIARMSGSGATCFGLFPPGADAACEEAAATITAAHADWWVVPTRLGAD